MAEKVEIIVTAKDAASQVLRGVTSSFGEVGNAIQALTSGTGIEYLTAKVIEFGKESVQATVAYADEVRRLSQITGANAEETSRLIQVADDYKVSVEALTAAQRNLAKDGITLTTETLAALSDEYNNLAPGAERASFLVEKFGRSGLQMAEIMQQGGEAIRQMSADIDENLVLTEKSIQAARRYEMAMDAWEEQTMKLQYAIGNVAVPAITEYVEVVNFGIDATKQLPEIVADSAAEFMRAGNAVDGAAAFIRKFNTDAGTMGVTLVNGGGIINQFAKNLAGITNVEINGISTAVENQARQFDGLANSIRNTTQANQEFLSMLSTVASAEQGFTAQMQQIESERMATQNELNAARAAGWWEQSDKVQGYIGKLGELDAKEKELTATYQESTAQRIFALTQQKLAVDGLSDAETNYLLEVGQKMGIYTQEQVDATKKQLSEAQKLADGFKTQQNEMTTAEQEKFATSGEQWRLYTETVTSQLDTNIASVNAYIAALGDIPTNVTTDVAVNTTGGNTQDVTGNATGAGSVVYYIQNAYIDASNRLSQVI